jgi:hypothetical protein
MVGAKQATPAVADVSPESREDAAATIASEAAAKKRARSAVASTPFQEAFRLAPPPSPTAEFSVGSASPEATPQVVVFDDSPPRETPTKSELAARALKADLNVCPAYVDDEAGLLAGDDDENDGKPSGGAHLVAPRRHIHDGLDSASGSECGDHQAPVPVEAPANPARKMPDVPNERGASQAAPKSSASESHAAASQPPPQYSAAAADGGFVGMGARAAAKAEAKAAAKAKAKAAGRGGAPSPEEWQDLAAAQVRLRSDLAPGLCRFKVSVPRPAQYPGVQFRKSKRLDDRYDRFAENGAVLVGKVEDNGMWLRITDERSGALSDNLFIPIRINETQLLEPILDDRFTIHSANSRTGGSTAAQQGSQAQAKNQESWWSAFSWCSGCQGVQADSEIDVVSHEDNGGGGGLPGVGANSF